MKKIALIGANGYVGSSLKKSLLKNKNYKLTSVTRNNYLKFKSKKYDYIINCAMPSARYWANNNPELDFKETVQKTADIAYKWNYNKLIQISTISARSELNTIYGINKKSAEVICNFDDNLIIRLTATFSNTLKKGILIDIIKGNKIYLNEKSRYSFASLEFVCDWITKNLDKKGVIEVGARNSISLKEITSKLNLNIEFEGRLDIQEVQNPSPEFPDSIEVLNFLKEKLSK